MGGTRLDPKIKRHAAQHQADQHHRHRQIQRAQNRAVRQRENGQQDANAQHQPGLIGIPERADTGNHAVFMVLAGAAHQHPHAKVIAVHDHISQHRQPHHTHENNGHPAGCLGQVRCEIKHVQLLIAGLVFRGN